MLSGIRVIELSTLIAGPYCAMLLGDLGAEVIKVENPQSGDPTRTLGGAFTGGESALFLGVNRNKKALALDIRREKGREILMRLAEKSDVIVENLRPDVLRDLRIGYEFFRGVNPEIIYCALTGFGEDGPYRMKPGTDMIFQSMGGIMMVSGNEGDPPIRVGVTPADMAAALYAALGVLCALYHRERTGRGQKISLSLMNSLIAFQASRITEFLVTGQNPPRTGRASPFATPAEFYQTRDGYITIAVFTEKFWRRLCRVLGLEALAEDPRFMDNQNRTEHQEELRQIMEDILRQKTTGQWRELLDREDIPNAPIYTYEEMFRDPNIGAENMVMEVLHPSIGAVKLVDQPLRFGRDPAGSRSHPPLLGEHTLEILQELDLSKEEIEALKADNVIQY